MSAKFGKTPNTIVTPTEEKYVYKIIETLDKKMFGPLQRHYDVMQETAKMFNAGHDLIMFNLKEILSKTVTSVSLRKRFLRQLGL